MRQQQVAKSLEEAQPTPTDIDYSLERYNLTRRAYWVNGQREKALSLECPVVKPLGYVILLTDNGGILGSFVVDGKYIEWTGTYIYSDIPFIVENPILTIQEGN